MNSTVLIAAALIVMALSSLVGALTGQTGREALHAIGQQQGTVFLCTPGGGSCSVYYTTRRD